MVVKFYFDLDEKRENHLGPKTFFEAAAIAKISAIG